jgi:hypothetical protein
MFHWTRCAILTVVGLMALSAAVEAQDTWSLARTTTSGSCSLQSTATLPSQGEELTRGAGKKAACETAKQLKTEDRGDDSHCLTYTPGTIALCSAQGVRLDP